MLYKASIITHFPPPATKIIKNYSIFLKNKVSHPLSKTYRGRPPIVVPKQLESRAGKTKRFVTTDSFDYCSPAYALPGQAGQVTRIDTDIKLKKKRVTACGITRFDAQQADNGVYGDRVD